MTIPLPNPDTPYHLVMLSFAAPGAADAAWKEVRAAGALNACEIEAEAVVSRDAHGRVHAHERGSAGIGAAFGAATAGIVGLVGGPVILPILVAVGAVMGGIAGHFAGQVLPADDLRRVADSLTPGTSAYLAIVDRAHAADLVDAFAAHAPTVHDMPVETAFSTAIREGIFHQVQRVL